MLLDRNRLVALIGAGIAIRLLIVATSIGTNDTVFMILWIRLVGEHGIAGAYSHMWALNHPPLTLLLLSFLSRAGAILSVEPTDLLRVVQVGADVVTAGLLAQISAITGRVRAAWAFFFFSPAAIAISAFHCNTDAMLVTFIVAGVYLTLRQRPWLAGVLLGLGFGIKIVALFAVPFLFIAHRSPSARMKFATAFSAATAVIFLPVLVGSGGVMVRNVFGYSGFSGKWGPTAILLMVEELLAEPRTTPLFSLALVYANHGKYLVGVGVLLLVWWFREPLRRSAATALPGVIALAYLVVLVLAPGYGVQYLVWPLALFPFVRAPRQLLIAGWIAIAAYVVITYTVWSEGFPWWYGDSIKATAGKPALVPIGIAVWALLLAVVIASLRKTGITTRRSDPGENEMAVLTE
jgi:hypothetical protein